VLNGDVILAVITGKDSREFANSRAFATIDTPAAELLCGKIR